MIGTKGKKSALNFHSKHWKYAESGINEDLKWADNKNINSLQITQLEIWFRQSEVWKTTCLNNETKNKTIIAGDLNINYSYKQE